MTRFRFRLERVMAWWHTELELAESLFRRQSAVVAALDSRSFSLEEAGRRAEAAVREWPAVTGADLAALDAFRHDLERRRRELLGQRSAAHRELERLRGVMLEARRHYRLVEILKEKRLAEWSAQAQRELEQMSAEAATRGWRAGGQ